jgi:O-antigen/teichoic acid export membrane protein
MTLKRMMTMMLGLVGLRIAGAVLNLLSQVIFTRIFTAADVGVIFLSMSTAAFFGLLATLGYPWLVLTQLPRFQTLGLQKIQHAMHGAFLRDGMVVGAVLVVGSYIAVTLFTLPLETKIALLFGCLAAPASMLMRYGSSVANSMRLFSLSYLPDFIVRPLLLLIYIFVLLLLGIKISLLHALIAFTVMLYLVSLGQSYVLGKRGPMLSDIFTVRPALTQALRPRAASLMIVALVATSFADLVTMIAGFLLKSEDLAVLSVTVRLAAMAGFIIQVTQQFVLPDLTAALTQRDVAKAHHLLLRLNYMTIATIFASLVGALIFGKLALSVFGPDYVGGLSLLIALLIGQSIRAFSGMNQQLLSIAGYQARTAGACVVALLVLYAGSIIGVREFGVIGMGYAVIATELVWSVMLAAQAQSLTKSRGDIFWLLQSAKH